MRKTFIDELIIVAKKNKKIILIVNDLGYGVVEKFANRYQIQDYLFLIFAIYAVLLLKEVEFPFFLLEMKALSQLSISQHLIWISTVLIKDIPALKFSCNM